MTGSCPYCGEASPPQARFCVKCGAPREQRANTDSETTTVLLQPARADSPPTPQVAPMRVPAPAPSPGPAVRPPVVEQAATGIPRQAPGASDLGLPAVQQPAPATPPKSTISGYEAARYLRRRMSIAGAICGTVMGFLIGIGRPLIREVLDSPPNVLLGAMIALLVLAGPWAAWHVWGQRGRLVLLADADDLIKFWLLGAFFMVLAGTRAR